MAMRNLEGALQEIELEKSLCTGSLDISSCNLSSIPEEVFTLTHLVSLNLNFNKIKIIPDQICKLHFLKELKFINNEICEIPACVGDLILLEDIHMSHNKITKIPKTFSKLNKLKQLVIGHNDFSTFPEHIGELKSLQSLIANNIGIEYFPVSVTKLTNLHSLNLLGNSIPTIPYEFINLTHLNTFYVDTGSINSPPIEIVSRGSSAIINYLHAFDKDGETFKIREAKLIIVGQGAVGKTCLMNRLISDSFSEKGSTEGIEINEWQINAKDGSPFRINFWDFGGQEIYHSTHQFFLTKRSLYLFVWDARREDNILHFDYWFNVIKLLSDSSPTIVVMNKCDERIKTIDEASLSDKFTNIISFHKVSAFTGTGIDLLKTNIKESILNLKHIGDVLPKSWQDIRNFLEKLNRDYISYEDYIHICNKFGLTEEKACFLSQYYHDLGVFLHFSDNPLLKQIIFLNPELATNAVYKLVDTKHVIESFGCFSFGDLKSIWKDYPEPKHIYILELMKKFELCFQLSDTEKFIIPELLNTNKPQIEWDDTDNLQFTYCYEFMPAGIITRFIVRTHNYNTTEIYWKNGLILSREGTHALIISEPLNRRIKIKIKGNEKQALLSIIRKELDYIHKTLNNPQHIAQISCSCSFCLNSVEPYMHDFDYLIKAKANGKWAVDCKNSFDNVRIIDILKFHKQKDKFISSKEGSINFNNKITNEIHIGDIVINRDYSIDFGNLTGISAKQYRLIIENLSKLNIDQLKSLKELSLSNQPSDTLMEQIQQSLKENSVSILQSLSASTLFELLKFLFQ